MTLEVLDEATSTEKTTALQCGQGKTLVTSIILKQAQNIYNVYSYVHIHITGEITRDEGTVSMHTLSDDGGINHPLDASNSPSASSSSPVPFEFERDMGKLLDLKVNLHQLEG